MRIKYFLMLARPANIVTAIADILAGVAIAGAFSGIAWPDYGPISLLALATTGLYAGGIVFNDIFDLEADRTERPERILPSGKIGLSTAYVFGGSLLLMGVIAASLVSLLSGSIALLVALLALCYDKFGKHFQVLGPINMGLCRAGNLLLGISLSPTALAAYWWVGVIPVLFIAAVTLTSQKEAVGNNKRSISFALGLDVVILGLIIGLSLFLDYNLLVSLPFIAIWFLMNTVGKIRAIRQNNPSNIQMAVKMGVISLISLDASLAAGFSDSFLIGLLVLLLLPCSVLLAKRFAVT
jgi:4-hydroxybenzoate polyprenyltransferase